MLPLKPESIERPWGNFRTFIRNSLCTVKILKVLPHESLSLQYHHKRNEFWRVIKGNPIIEIGGTKLEYYSGDEIFISVGTTHRIRAQEESVEILEIATGEFDEEDIVRIDDKYGRTT